MNEEQRGWPSAAVAIAIVALIGAITIKAIDQYDEVGDTLQIWQAIDAVFGVIIGAVGTYFFNRETVQNAQTQAKNAVQMAAQQERRASLAEARLETAARMLSPQQREAVLMGPGVQGAPSPPGNAAGTTRPAAG